MRGKPRTAMRPIVETRPAVLRIDWPTNDGETFYEVVPQAPIVPEAVVVDGQVIDLRTVFLARQVTRETLTRRQAGG